MTKEALDNEWWVIGNVEAGMYLHWKGDGVSGSFTDCCSPEDAEVYDSAEDAARAIREDEDVQAEIANWKKPAGPVHVKKGVIVSDEPAGSETRNKAIRQARLLYCMDYIMHALSDEEAIEPWLAEGVEDGLYQQSREPPADEYDVYDDMSQADFDEMVGLFIRTLAFEGGYATDGRTLHQVGKAVLS